jgi:hypothetical protein
MKNFYIKLLRYGYKNPQGFSYKEIIEDNPLKLNNEEKEIIKIYLQVAYNNNYRGLNNETPFKVFKESSDTRQCTYIISYEAFFNYIDYLELKIAKKMSKEAYISSRKAIIITGIGLAISVLSFFASIYFSIKQINTPIKINESQFEMLKK